MALLEPTSGVEIEQKCADGVLVIKKPWPSIARTIFGDHQRYLETYMSHYPGYYFTGDGAQRDKEGYYWINGRVDDVINVSGHRLGTAELESALVKHPSCPEAAVVAIPDEIRGSSIVAFCVLREGFEDNEIIKSDLKLQIRKTIGAFATPHHIIIAPGLPKTRSGKIMRRILRKIASKEFDSLGDLSTLDNNEIVNAIIEKVRDS